MKGQLFLIVCLAGLAGCGNWTTTTITLSNETGTSITGISADFAGRPSRAGPLAPGQSITLASYSGGEGLLCLKYRQNGSERRYAIDYMTEGLPTHYRVTLNDRTLSSISSDQAGDAVRKPRVHRPLASDTQCPA